MLKDYKLVIANREGVTLSFIIEDFFLADNLEAALIHAGYPDVQIYSLVKSYIDERHVHTEEDLLGYDIYTNYLTYCDQAVDHVEVPSEEVLFNGN